MVLGENLDTDESSGAGKSSLVESLAYVFDYSTFTGADLQTWSWLSDSPMRVGIDFTVTKSGDSSEVEYVRGKKPSLVVDGDQVCSGSAKEVKESLERLVGVRPDVLKALTYRAQNQPGLFLSMKDQEKKSFLTELLGLQPYEADIERSVKTISELEQQEVTKRAIADSVRAQVPGAPERPEPIGIKLHEETLAKLRSEIVKAESALERLRVADSAALEMQVRREQVVRGTHLPLVNSLKSKVASIRANEPCPPEVSVPSFPPELGSLKKKLALLREAIAVAKSGREIELRSVRAELKASENASTQLVIEGQNKSRTATTNKARVESELAVLETLTCDRCNRAWADEAHAATLNRKRAELLEWEALFVDASAVLARAAKELDVGKGLAERVRELESTNPVSAKLESGEREFAQKVSEAEADYRAAVASAEQRASAEGKLLKAEWKQQLAEAEADVSKAERDFSSALNEAQEMTQEHVKLRDSMGSVRDLLNGLGSDLRIETGTIESIRYRNEDAEKVWKREYEAWQRLVAHVQLLDQEHQDVLARLNQERDYLGCIRGFLGAIFDETLDRIAFLTNERLAKVPNVQGLALRFVSEHETKTTKNVRQEIRPVIERDGHEIPLRRTSGGQFTGVELAVDLSLADVIAERTGILPGWLILDEAFNGLPTKSKTACLELLRDAAETRLILVIDHATEFKAMFQSVITVRSQDGRSSFV